MNFGFLKPFHEVMSLAWRCHFYHFYVPKLKFRVLTQEVYSERIQQIGESALGPVVIIIEIRPHFRQKLGFCISC